MGADIQPRHIINTDLLCVAIMYDETGQGFQLIPPEQQRYFSSCNKKPTIFCPASNMPSDYKQ